MFEGLRSVGLITGLINTDVSKQFRDQSLAIVVVLRLKAGEFLPARARCGFDSEGASVFYTILLPSHRDSRVSLSLSLSLCPLGSRASGLDGL